MADYVAIPFKRYPKAPEDRRWDGAAARRRLKEWAGEDWAKYRKGFALYDRDRDTAQGGYKLPHHDVIDGRVKVVWAGVRSAMQDLLGARGGLEGVPREVRKAAHGHLAKEYDLFDKEVPEFRVHEEQVTMSEHHRDDDEILEANVAVARVESLAEPTDEQVARINQFTMQELEADQVAVFPMQLSNQNIDSYGTRMAKTSLSNYAADAMTGLPFMNSHRTNSFFGPPAELPHGVIFEGRVEGEEGDLILREFFYLQRGITLNGQRNDDLIAAIAGGTVRSVSIGFTMNPAVAPLAWYRCGLCDLDMWRDEDCPHLPLRVYDGEMAFAWVEEARQNEGSMVWKGATPGAFIEKARGQVADGVLPASEVDRLEGLYGVRLRAPRKYWTPKVGVGGRERKENESGGDDVELDEIRVQILEARPDLEDRIGEAEDPIAELLAVLIETENSRDGLFRGLEEAQGAIEDLTLEAEAGRQYRADLVEQAIEARVRAQGHEFDVEGYREQLGGASLDYVKSEIQAHERAAGQMFQPGRPTQNGSDDETPRVRRPHLYQ